MDSVNNSCQPRHNRLIHQPKRAPQICNPFSFAPCLLLNMIWHTHTTSRGTPSYKLAQEHQLFFFLIFLTFRRRGFLIIAHSNALEPFSELLPVNRPASICVELFEQFGHRHFPSLGDFAVDLQSWVWADCSYQAHYSNSKNKIKKKKRRKLKIMNLLL